MIIFYGIYHFKQKVVACRQDYCNFCKQPTAAHQMRFFACGHFSFIPLIPLGWRHAWYCPRCSNDPREDPLIESQILRPITMLCGMAGAFLLIWSLFFLKASFNPEDRLPVIITGLALLAVAGFCQWVRQRGKRMKIVRPAVEHNTQNCVFCGEKLSTDPDLHCQTCQLRVYTD
jgi:hypothetical protein